MNHIDRRRLAVYLIEQSKSIQRGLVWSTAFMAAGIIAAIMFRDAWGGLVYLIGVTVAIVAGMSFVLNALRIRGIDRFRDDTDDKPKGQPRRDTAYMSQHRTQNARLIATSGNTLLVCKFQPDYGTWGDLADKLYNNGWEWSRDRALKESGCFKNLNNRYKAITDEMIRIGFVEGRVNHYKVSFTGRHQFIEQSPRLSLEHIR